MEGKVDESRDLISDLPLSILHRILSYLPFNSVRTSVLSTQWSSVGKSFPILKFLMDMFDKIQDYKPYEDSLRKYLDFVDRTLQYVVHNKLRIERMDLDLWEIDPESIPLTNTRLSIALHSGVSDLTFNLSEYQNETLFVVNSSRLRGSTEFFRIEKLLVKSVWLSENLVRDFIRNCPNLSDISLYYIRGSETLNNSKPNKLVSLFLAQTKANNLLSIN